MFRYMKCLNAFFSCMQLETWKRIALHLFRISWESAALILVWRFLFHLHRIFSVTLHSMRVFCLHEWDLISRCYDYVLWRISFCVRRVKICLHSGERIGRVWEQGAEDRERESHRMMEILRSLIIPTLILIILELRRRRTCSSHDGN
jgi:hypothetical protein